MRKIFLIFLLILNLTKIICQSYEVEKPSPKGCKVYDSLFNQYLNDEEFTSKLYKSISELVENSSSTISNSISNLIKNNELDIPRVFEALKKEQDMAKLQGVSLQDLCNRHYMLYATSGYPKEEADLEFKTDIERLGAVITSQVYFLVADLFLSNDYLILQQEGERYCDTAGWSDYLKEKDGYDLCKYQSTMAP